LSIEYFYKGQTYFEKFMILIKGETTNRPVQPHNAGLVVD
jgi:hypothetical protein